MNNSSIYMRQLRRDPVIDRWVIIAEDRANRPMPPPVQATINVGAFCPFCEGNEASTPPESFALRSNSIANEPGWSLRVVPNKFPALEGVSDIATHDDGLYTSSPGAGAHEVIIEAPDHNIALADMPIERVVDLFSTAKERMIEFKKDERLKSVHFFKNHGVLAGASLPHPHSQLIAMEFVSSLLNEEIAGALKKYEQTGECVYCQIIKREIQEGERMILEDNDYIAIAPYAPRFALETWIMPKKHGASFEQADTIEQLAKIYKKVVGKMNSLLNNPDYNMALHTAPFNLSHSHAYHWHIEMWPVTTRVAAFEWGSGIHINSSSPESSARAMRKAPPQ